MLVMIQPRSSSFLWSWSKFPFSLHTNLLPHSLSHQRYYATTHADSSMDMYDVAVIGGGPGGYVAAIKAAQLGLKTVCIEKRGSLGGTCLNVGCIPSKTLLNNSHLYHQAKHDMQSRGIDISSVQLNLHQMMQNKSKIVSSLTGGIEMLFKKNKVTYVKGHGAFQSPNVLEVTLNESNQRIQLHTKHTIIATGSDAVSLPNIPIDEHKIVSSTGALDFKQVPDHLIVVGAGVIGLELGSVWNRLGSQVTFIEYLDRLGAGMDMQVAKAFQKILVKQGLQFKFNTKVLKTNIDNAGTVTVHVEDNLTKKVDVLTCNNVLVSIGRAPYTQKLGLDKIGVHLDEKQRVKVDPQFKTNIANVWAIGDVIAGPMLAHKAEEEGIAVVENLVSQAGHVNYNSIPSVIYTHPEVAWVGLSEEQCQGKAYSVGTFPFLANSRAKANGDTEGLVKIITDSATDQILGAHIIGPNAGEMIGEATLAIEYGASSEDVARTCHAHPTLSEAFKEACMASHGHKKAIHF